MQNRIKLIGLPYAGGNKFSFNEFYQYLGDSVESITLELPGRGKRISERLLDDLDSMTDDLYLQIRPYLQDDYILYGHSMGGILGNLLIRKILSNNKKPPSVFLITGCAAPQFRKKEAHLHVLTDAKLKDELGKLGGFPDEIMHNDELMEFLLPIIRADIKALETYAYQQDPRYKVPVTIIIGDNEDISDEQLYGWELETSGPFEAHKFEGNHFFILDHFEALADLVHEKVDAIRGKVVL